MNSIDSWRSIWYYASWTAMFVRIAGIPKHTNTEHNGVVPWSKILRCRCILDGVDENNYSQYFMRVGFSRSNSVFLPLSLSVDFPRFHSIILDRPPLTTSQSHPAIASLGSLSRRPPHHHPPKPPPSGRPRPRTGSVLRLACFKARRRKQEYNF